ncbi:MAG: JAB domain-containing protein [Bacteroidota bacterium]
MNDPKLISSQFITSVDQNYLSVSELKLIYKQNFNASERPKINNSIDSYNILLSSWDKDLIDYLEEFKILLLNTANKVIGCIGISKGGFRGTIADPRVIFAAALTGCASSIILAHNHPSGNLKPSDQDISLTNKLKNGGLLLDIMVVDHIIITSEGYYSFADNGLI